MEDSSGVVFTSDFAAYRIYDLYQSSFYESGPNPIKLISHTTTTLFNYIDITPDNQKVVYITIVTEGYHLFSTDIYGAGDPQD